MRVILAAALLAAQFQHPLYIFPDKRMPRIARQAVPLVKVPAEYTPEARKARISGIVIVRALVEVKGNVSATRVEKPLPFGLAAKAEDAVRKWKFEPGRDVFARPARCTYLATVNFKLE
jgi:TonB family protein